MKRWIVLQVFIALFFLLAVLDAFAPATNGNQNLKSGAGIWVVILGFMFFWANRKRKAQPPAGQKSKPTEDKSEK